MAINRKEKRRRWKMKKLLIMCLVAATVLGSLALSGCSSAKCACGHGHKEGSAACIEAHKTGKCSGHEPGGHPHSK
jgi:hypothetical protein